MSITRLIYLGFCSWQPDAYPKCLRKTAASPILLCVHRPAVPLQPTDKRRRAHARDDNPNDAPGGEMGASGPLARGA